MKHADLIWDETGTPCSSQFDDVYFSKVGGLDETRHVFLAHNQLPERFQALSKQDERKTFVVAETGFGTGLNFLACCQLWDEHMANSNHELVFVSTEMYPLTHEDLQKALSVWPELEKWSTPLMNSYPKVCTGLQTLRISGKIRLILAFGDAAESFSKLNASIDAWFLDGFAPSKNPEMWSDRLFQQIQRLSHQKTSFATFTAARVVKDLLTNHGFEFKKAKGFGRKRDMIHGHFVQANAPHNSNANTEVWYQTPILSHPNKTAIVVGAGLAGAHTANGLANRGWQVTVLEQGECVASGASGNYQGVLYTKPSVQETKEDSFYLASFQYAVQHYQAHFSESEIWQQAGLIQLAQSEKEALKLTRVNEKYLGTSFNQKLSPEQATQKAGVDLNTNFDALFYPDSGWVNPAEACRALLNHSNIQVICNTKASSVERTNSIWNVTLETASFSNESSKDARSSEDTISSKNKVLSADIVVLCSAWEANQFEQMKHLPLTPIRGQVSQVDLATTSAEAPNTVICADSYVTPSDNNKLNFGATFDLKDSDASYRNEDIKTNVSKLQSISTEFKVLDELNEEQITGRASVRCITSDRLPVVGMINDHDAMLDQYQQLAKDRKWPYQEPGSYHPGLYANLGHGSKGLTTIPLCSELLCAMVENDPLLLHQELIDSLNPTRFTINGLIKGKF
ncbi:bifunctional tRNA (5-methylaminomethyl-2-thiouridine)(34)-methyltransferase MnmD/FAD-dependent 5-carboxymethylaminomethyl-2-thiouridine(34) oxidoreductase MnmC [Litoribrevibacter albus]|uniref:tRNA 5-methylaminomethyl-2-thiouridine biosynthesis bifunctional protein MnmC n=1 Tax=Litoribrevibacter albus TaxID=1473156 RepID=A0AA37S9Y1_9GAMM|nr:bifunctional tRNA (5-methylaminomethyl-2-thiouridine)(34)-methyltransferase MnmD/FAD-dependent 5-carboxymethylaminomethyl-2-thiouridine(34) oxidoreductase MnmC [Litoribrevibacter albus]GLQ30782.1 tRNA 5-methylaminomethyl-2-thiouridine biosynthesis bifunctional protein MnmC [Litoribrevibacter albus]